MLIFALAALAATPGEFLLPWGMLPAAPAAVDHVAVVIVDPGHGPEPREQRREIARSGPWLREAIGPTVSHHDFATGASVTHWRDDASGYRGFMINRHPSDDRPYRYRRARTGERDHALGEECVVWRSDRADAPATSPYYLTCETADGIQLWSRTVSSVPGLALGWSRTVSFTRRPVPAAEVRPPRRLLRWQSWRDLATAADAVATAPGPPRNYEVRLEGSRGRERAQIFRASHGWAYSEVRGQALRSISIRGNGVVIDYREEPNGRPVALTVRQVTAPERPFVQLPVPDGPPAPPFEQVIGETCSWAPPDNYRRCVTRDGLPLRIQYEHRGLIADLTATFLARRQLPISALEPPQSAFSWSAWDIVPAG